MIRFKIKRLLIFSSIFSFVFLAADVPPKNPGLLQKLRANGTSQPISTSAECLEKLKQQQYALQLQLFKKTEKSQEPLNLLWYGEHIFHLFRSCARSIDACAGLTEQELENAPAIFRQLADKINVLVLAQEQIKKILQLTEIQNEQIQRITRDALKKSRD